MWLYHIKLLLFSSKEKIKNKIYIVYQKKKKKSLGRQVKIACEDKTANY